MVWGWGVGQDTQGCRRGRSLLQGGQLLLFIIHALVCIGSGGQAPGELPWAWVRAVGGGAAVKGFNLSWSAGAPGKPRQTCSTWRVRGWPAGQVWGGVGGGWAVRALLALGDAEPQARDKSQGGLKVRVGVWWDLGMGEGMKFGQL